MAKAVIPLHNWRRREGTTRDRGIGLRVRELFAAAMFGDDTAGNGRPSSSRNGS